MEEEYESVLWIARECYVYRLPPRTSTAGYKASEWGDMEAFLWKGRLRVIEKSGAQSKCFIRLEDANTGDLFANCPYSADGTAVEPVLDSQRYFVLRVEGDGGQRAFLGMGFLERSDSFDFNVALQDWTKRQRVQSQSDEAIDSDYLYQLGWEPEETIFCYRGGGPLGSGSKGGAGGAMPLLPPPPPPRGR